MRAVLRRRSADAGAGALGSEALEVGDVALDPERHEVVIRGDSVQLPLKEFALLEILLANAGRVLPRDTIIARVGDRKRVVWGKGVSERVAPGGSRHNKQ